ncbi:hypothetical protein C8R41DRAFT_761346 [Lentinula lateritia]|uniref:DUF6729 domain-containing protein n=1 Tax=Lentinula lateritia TaxID=40482 RepID=A0ABQ8VJQ1_9AGAR|nr:hypothetical protein C8R41DRAFT_761346 [Lentinula lateritia]
MNITTPDSYLDDAKNKKRRPGRPKGTGKKVKERIVSHKRPVGRPRRDGLPSGSVSIRPKRVVIQLDDDWGKSLQNEPDSFLSSLVVALSVLPPPASSGPTAEEAFKSHLNSLAPTSSHNQHLPTLYSILKTFWLPTSPAYFSLTASASARTLSDHRFFYWDPQPLLFNGISCPSCSSSLHNEGRIKRGPLKIYDVERPFYIIGAEYVCKNEGKSFASIDPSILRALPAKLRDELPVRLVHVNDVGSDENIWCWKPAGVSKTLWNLVLGCVRGGLKKDMVIKLIRDTQKGIHQMVEPSKSSNSNEGFTDAYSDAWTANIATADEDNDTQQPDPPTESFSSYNQTSTTHTSLAAAAHAPGPRNEPMTASLANTPHIHPRNEDNNGVDGHPSITGPSSSPQSNLAGVPTFQHISGSSSDAIGPSLSSTSTPIPATTTSADGSRPRQRNPRHCSKCGSTTCKGKGGRSYCTNACKDCGRFECRGRNSRRPEKNCEDGWIK